MSRVTVNRLHRRRLLRQWLLTGAASIVAPFIGASSTVSSPALSARLDRDAYDSIALLAPPTAQPRGEQVLRLTGPTFGPETLDPATALDAPTVAIVRNIFRGLLKFDTSMDVVPDLAQRMSVDASGHLYSFVLRPDVTYHDGTPITAEDVRYSLRRALDPATAFGNPAALTAASFLSDIVGAAELLSGRSTDLPGVRVRNAETVEIELIGPRASFPLRLAGVSASVVDRRQTEGDPQWWRAPNGSGPFAVARWTFDQELLLERHDNYQPTPALLDRLTYRLGASAAQQFNVFLAGETDVEIVPPSVIDRVLDPTNPMLDLIVAQPTFAVSYIAFDPTVPPMDDPMVRRAIQQVFPRERVANVTFDGVVEPAQGLIPDGMLGTDWPVDWPEPDADVARAMLAESRYDPEIMPPLRIHAGRVASGVKTPSEALRDVVQTELGIPVEVILVPWGEYLSGLAERRYSAYSLYWIADYPDPESLLWMLFGADSLFNYIGYENATFEFALDAARTAPGVEERIEAYREAQRILLEDGVVIPLYVDVSYVAARTWVRGLPLTPIGMLGFESIWMER